MKALQDTRVSLASVSLAAATTARTALLDAINASSAKLLVATGANTNSSANCTIAITTGSDATSTTDYVSIGTTAAAVTTEGVRVVDIDMRGKDRYLYVTVTPGTNGTTDQITVGSIVGLFETGLKPSNSTTQVGNVVFA
jgi:hypothetical protein